jgi:hypothetical protein
VGRNDAIAQEFLSTLCPHRSHLFASLPWHADRGCWLEAIDRTICYIAQEGCSERHTVGLSESPSHQVPIRWMTVDHE